MWQKNGFDRYPEFKSKGIEFEVEDVKISRKDQVENKGACSSKPLARYYHENKSKRPS
jgi:hypothetical protein